MIGLIEHTDHIVTATFKQAGESIYLLGKLSQDLNGSEFLSYFYGELGIDAPPCDLDEEKALQEFLVAAAKEKLLQSAHDVSDGGLAIALLESAILNQDVQVGFSVNLELAPSDTAIQATLFSEAQGRVVISVSAEKQHALETLAKSFGLICQKIGETKKERVEISINHQKVFEASLNELNKVYFHALEEAIGMQK